MISIQTFPWTTVHYVVSTCKISCAATGILDHPHTISNRKKGKIIVKLQNKSETMEKRTLETENNRKQFVNIKWSVTRSHEWLVYSEGSLSECSLSYVLWTFFTQSSGSSVISRRMSPRVVIYYARDAAVREPSIKTSHGDATLYFILQPPFARCNFIAKFIYTASWWPLLLLD